MVFFSSHITESSLSIGICHKVPSLNSLRDNTVLTHNLALCRHGWPNWLRLVKDSMMTLTWSISNILWSILTMATRFFFSFLFWFLSDGPMPQGKSVSNIFVDSECICIVIAFVVVVWKQSYFIKKYFWLRLILYLYMFG